MKKLIVSILICSLTLISFSANDTSTKNDEMENTAQDNTCYYLENYIICPQTKEVKYMIRVGGIDWDGFDYVVDSIINYDKTQLIFIQGKAFFKEYLKNVDIEKLRILETKKLHRNLYTEITDGDSVFVFSHNKLYPTGPYIAENKKEKNTIIKRGKAYTAYEDSIIVNVRYTAKQLDLDLSRTKEYLIDDYYNTYIITDGNKTYLHSLFYQGTQLMELEFLRGKDVTAIADKKHLWRINQSNQTIYMNLSKIENEKIKYPEGTIGWEGFLFSATDGYYLVNRDGLYKKASSFNILNEAENGFERYDGQTMKKRLKILNRNYYIQNSKLYGYEYLVYNQDSIEVNKLYQLESENIQTEFYTDGNLLIDLGESSGIRTMHEELVLEHRIISGIDLKSLIIINENTLKDDNNLYYRKYDKIEVIPLDKIGIPIRVIVTPETSKLIR